MFDILEVDLHEINFITVMLRLLLALICGGAVGLERGSKKHQAGFRTHILVCTGATLAMMTNQYIIQVMEITSDPARLGAQVISGIGFLGVGVIVSSSRTRIKGLTTAAGLWASACFGLAFGVGFYSGGIAAAIMIFIVLAFMQNFERIFYSTSKNMDIYLEVENLSQIRLFINHIRAQGIVIDQTHVSKSTIMSEGGLGLYASIRLPKRRKHLQVMKEFRTLEMVEFVEEM